VAANKGRDMKYAIALIAWLGIGASASHLFNSWASGMIWGALVPIVFLAAMSGKEIDDGGQ
jgi:hypothetical protein